MLYSYRMRGPDTSRLVEAGSDSQADLKAREKCQMEGGTLVEGSLELIPLPQNDYPWHYQPAEEMPRVC